MSRILKTPVFVEYIARYDQGNDQVSEKKVRKEVVSTDSHPKPFVALCEPLVYDLWAQKERLITRIIELESQL